MSDHVCRPVVDESGEVLGHARVAPDLGPDGEAALLALVTAARQYLADEDAADPEGAAERQARYEAGQERIRERNARVRGQADRS